eukprot:PhF_6_TR10078/c1_g1_i2/m.15659
MFQIYQVVVCLVFLHTTSTTPTPTPTTALLNTTLLNSELTQFLLFISPLQQPHEATWNPVYYPDPCTWTGVVCSPDGLYVKEIKWFYMTRVVGVLNLSLVPRNVEKLTIRGSLVSGVLVPSELPSNLTVLDLQDTLFQGYLRFEDFPRTLTTMNLGPARFTGEAGNWETLPKSLTLLSFSGNKLTTPRNSSVLNLTGLPATLEYLFLDRNDLSGKVVWTSLPSGLKELWLSRNPSLGGSMYTALSSLPPNLKQFHADYNNFTGVTNFTVLPLTIESLTMKANRLSGTLYFSRLPPNLHTLTLSSNNFTGTINFEAFPESLQSLDLTNNSLSGRVRLQGLPSNIQSVELAMNHFSGTPDLDMTPESLQYLSMYDNDFCGFVLLRNDTSTSTWCARFDATRICDYDVLPHVECPPGDGYTFQFYFRCGYCPPPTPAPPTPPPTAEPGSALAAMLDVVSGLRGTKPSSWSLQTPSVCNWDGVVCEGGKPVQIVWLNQYLYGSMNWASLPSSLTRLTVSMSIRGTLSTSALPRNLQHLDIQNTYLSGTISWFDLPKSLTHIQLSKNNFGGIISLCQMPPLVSYVNVSRNSFTMCSLSSKDGACNQLFPAASTFKTVDLSLNNISDSVNFTWLFSKLENVKTLDLGGNQLECVDALITEQLPVGMTVLNLSRNMFSCELNGSLAAIPSALTSIDVSRNNFSSSNLNMTGWNNVTDSSLQFLYLNDNNFSGEFTLSSLPRNIEVVDVSNNRFFGEVSLNQQLRNLPSLTSLRAAQNAFRGTIECRDTNLEYLDFEANQIHGTVIASNLSRSLQVLKLRGNQIVDVDFTNMQTIPLTELDLGDNALASLRDDSYLPLTDLRYCLTLRSFYIDANPSILHSDLVNVPFTVIQVRFNGTGLCGDVFFPAPPNAQWCGDSAFPMCTSVMCPVGTAYCPPCPPPRTQPPQNTTQDPNATSAPSSNNNQGLQTSRGSSSSGISGGVIVGVVLGSLFVIGISSIGARRILQWKREKEDEGYVWTFSDMKKYTARDYDQESYDGAVG